VLLSGLEFALPDPAYALNDTLIEALGDLACEPAVEYLFKLRGTEYDVVATRALIKLAPERLAGEMVATALDKRIGGLAREQALGILYALSASNHVCDLAPLLEDTTPVSDDESSGFGRNCRICDRAAATIASLLGWPDQDKTYYLPEPREETMARVREWAASAR
jgi:hypothetical protein